jgi:hypothetical protein
MSEFLNIGSADEKSVNEALIEWEKKKCVLTS